MSPCIQYFDEISIDHLDIEGMLGEMRRLSWNDPAYALSILNAGITVAFIHGNNLRHGRVDRPEEAVDSDALLEERFDLLERLNRGVAVEFLEMSDMRRAYEAYKRSKGELAIENVTRGCGLFMLR